MSNLTPEQSQECKEYTQMYFICYPKAIGFAKKYVEKEEDAKDIVHSLFENLWKTGKWKDIAESPESYIMTAVRNNCFDFLNLANQKRNERIADNDDYPEQDAIDLDDKLTKEIEMKAVKKALLTLPEKCRKTIDLVYLEEKSHKEAAEILSVTVGTICKQQNIGIKKIRETLGITEKMKKK